MGRRRSATVGISLLMLVAGILIVGAALAGLGSKEKGRTIPPPTDNGDLAAVQPTPIPEATTPPAPTPEPSAAPIQRLMIPSIGVDAPIVVLSVDKDGVMQDPKGPKEIAWYDFSAKPGWGSNAVFAGHVDYHDYGPAVLWKLRELKLGEDINLRLQDGTEYKYKVTSSFTFSADDAPVQDIVGPTSNEVITIITCNGTFNTRTREYDKRLIVRAERQPAPAARTQ